MTQHPTSHDSHEPALHFVGHRHGGVFFTRRKNAGYGISEYMIPMHRVRPADTASSRRKQWHAAAAPQKAAEE